MFFNTDLWCNCYILWNKNESLTKKKMMKEMKEMMKRKTFCTALTHLFPCKLQIPILTKKKKTCLWISDQIPSNSKKTWAGLDGHWASPPSYFCSCQISPVNTTAVCSAFFFCPAVCSTCHAQLITCRSTTPLKHGLFKQSISLAQVKYVLLL